MAIEEEKIVVTKRMNANYICPFCGFEVNTRSRNAKWKYDSFSKVKQYFHESCYYANIDRANEKKGI